MSAEEDLKKAGLFFFSLFFRKWWNVIAERVSRRQGVQGLLTGGILSGVPGHF